MLPHGYLTGPKGPAHRLYGGWPDTSEHQVDATRAPRVGLGVLRAMRRLARPPSYTVGAGRCGCRPRPSIPRSRRPADPAARCAFGSGRRPKLWSGHTPHAVRYAPRFRCFKSAIRPYPGSAPTNGRCSFPRKTGPRYAASSQVRRLSARSAGGETSPGSRGFGVTSRAVFRGKLPEM